MNTHDKYELPPLPDCSLYISGQPGLCMINIDHMYGILTDYARAAIEADRKRRGEPEAWQPIETAPHEVEVLLGWREWDGAWKTEVSPASWSWGAKTASKISLHGQATHWMPMPPAPQPAVPSSKDSDDFFTNDNPKLRGLNQAVDGRRHQRFGGDRVLPRKDCRHRPRNGAAEMTHKHNGGPAFPLPVDAGECRSRFDSGYGGMSLRDYFAAQVIGPAFLDLFTGWRQRGESVQEDWTMGLAIDAYRVADAMLAQREE